MRYAHVLNEDMRHASVKLGKKPSDYIRQNFVVTTSGYFPRPRLRSQTTTSVMAPSIEGRTSSDAAQRVSRTNWIMGFAKTAALSSRSFISIRQN
jgi:hypothetical protein